MSFVFLLCINLVNAQETESQKIQTIENVVEKAGFRPTPAQSNIYKPGAILSPRKNGGHDVIAENCVFAEPTVSEMAQSDIATNLSAGVTARMAVAKVGLKTDIEKRTIFIDPVQLTLPVGKLQLTPDCANQVDRAGRLLSMTESFLIYDVLIAKIKNTTCTRIDSSGRVAVLAAAEAASYSECVQESDGQVAIGYKGIPLSLLQIDKIENKHTGKSSANFNVPNLHVEDLLKQQECRTLATSKASVQREDRFNQLTLAVKAHAANTWHTLRPQLNLCLELKEVSDRAPCIAAAQDWITDAESLVVNMSAGVEQVDTECGVLTFAFPLKEQKIELSELNEVKSLLASLSNQPDDIRFLRERDTEYHSFRIVETKNPSYAHDRPDLTFYAIKDSTIDLQNENFVPRFDAVNYAALHTNRSTYVDSIYYLFFRNPYFLRCYLKFKKNHKIYPDSFDIIFYVNGYGTIHDVRLAKKYKNSDFEACIRDEVPRPDLKNTAIGFDSKLIYSYMGFTAIDY